MNKVVVIIGASFILFVSFVILVALPYLRIQEGEELITSSVQNVSVQRGRLAYIDLGCVYCHSQQPRHKDFAPDELRGWGYQPEAQFYANQRPHLLGTMRTGPDLLNIGDRNPSLQWNLIHLYNPRLLVPWSIMPAYPFLFRKVSTLGQNDHALMLRNLGLGEPDEFVVASPKALDLVAYLQSLKQPERK